MVCDGGGSLGCLAEEVECASSSKWNRLKKPSRSSTYGFVFGGVVTALAGLVADHFGPVVGGIFLAFPGIYPAGVSLVEKHKTMREEKEGKTGVRSARGQASVETTGASEGALGLLGFAAVLWQGLPEHGSLPMLLCAGLAWLVISGAGWWVRERM